MSEAFDKGGQVLQDLVNELGRRLDFQVENGLYSGRVNSIGNDGLWLSPEGNQLIVEVKTSDAYRISLDVISRYRSSLMESGRVDANSSILIVVGRQGTGELEAQVRGSRHAWDIRLISADALVKLVQIKEKADELETGRQIRGILVPVEYTRVDALVDVVFAAATDVDEGFSAPSTEYAETLADESLGQGGRTHINLVRERIVSAFSAKLQNPFIKKSRALYWTSDHVNRLACTISKKYESGYDYWYAFHPAWRHFLADGGNSYFVLGCSDLNRAFALPLSFFENVIDNLNISETERGMYWHVHLTISDDGSVCLVVPRHPIIPIEEYAVKL